MNRASLIAAVCTAFLPTLVLAKTNSTVVVLTSNLPELDEDSSNFLVEALRSRNVNVIDISSMKLTLHERSSVVAVMFGPLVGIEAEQVSWVETKYGSARALFVHIRIDDSSLPYGEFRVHTASVTATFRCFNVVAKTVVRAGSFTSRLRGEDLNMLQSQAIDDSLLKLARASAVSLR